MPTYKAPLRDIKFLMNELLGAPEQPGRMPYYAQNETADQDLLEQVLDEAARFVETELAPLNVVGDREGCEMIGPVLAADLGARPASPDDVEGPGTSLGGARDRGPRHSRGSRRNGRPSAWSPNG